MELHTLRYASPAPGRQKTIQTLDALLRAGAGFSMEDEFPSLFGEYPGGESLYLESSGKLVSHVGVLVREFCHPAFRFKVGMLGSIVTAPEFRGQGMASRLIQDALELLKRRGATLSMLWSDATDFYKGFGFERAGREWDIKFSPSHLPYAHDSGVVEYDAARHAHAIWHLYQRHDSKVDRSLEEHKRLCAIPRARIFLTEKNGIVSSYLVVNKGADFENYIHEWGGEVEEVRRCLAWVQKRHFSDRNLTLIAPGHYRLEPLKRMALSHWEGVLGLVKVLDRANLMHAYCDYLKSRGITHRWQRDKQRFQLEAMEFNVTNDSECLRLVLGEGGVTPPAHPSLPFFLWGFDSI